MMKFFLPLVLIGVVFSQAPAQASAAVNNVPVLDTFLIGKASDTKFSCCLSSTKSMEIQKLRPKESTGQRLYKKVFNKVLT